jgi:6-pyruvoyltetrahydropterin/6-carboxytetrahydropterin synthase
MWALLLVVCYGLFVIWAETRSEENVNGSITKTVGGRMFRIRKQFHFSAAHQLEGLQPNHPCSRLHGHNYIVEVQLESTGFTELTPTGFVRDYRELDEFKHYLDTQVDHRNLNEIFEFQTTAENLAFQFWKWCNKRWPECRIVAVSETPKTWAEYIHSGI